MKLLTNVFFVACLFFLNSCIKEEDVIIEYDDSSDFEFIQDPEWVNTLANMPPPNDTNYINAFKPIIKSSKWVNYGTYYSTFPVTQNKFEEDVFIRSKLAIDEVKKSLDSIGSLEKLSNVQRLEMSFSFYQFTPGRKNYLHNSFDKLKTLSYDWEDHFKRGKTAEEQDLLYSFKGNYIIYGENINIIRNSNLKYDARLALFRDEYGRLKTNIFGEYIILDRKKIIIIYLTNSNLNTPRTPHLVKEGETKINWTKIGELAGIGAFGVLFIALQKVFYNTQISKTIKNLPNFEAFEKFTDSTKKPETTVVVDSNAKKIAILKGIPGKAMKKDVKVYSGHDMEDFHVTVNHSKIFSSKNYDSDEFEVLKKFLKRKITKDPSYILKFPKFENLESIGIIIYFKDERKPIKVTFIKFFKFNGNLIAEFEVLERWFKILEALKKGNP